MESVEDKASDIRTIFKTDEFEEFYNGLDEKVKDKFEYTFELVQTVYAIPVKYVKHLEGTDLYEMRVSVGSNEYRTVLFAIDNSNVILSSATVPMTISYLFSENVFFKNLIYLNKLVYFGVIITFPPSLEITSSLIKSEVFSIKK